MQSDDYKNLIERAEKLRHADDCQTAIGFYEQALKIGGELDTHCEQMIGVCLNGLDKPAEALDRLDRALDKATDDLEKGAIWRDKSASYRKLKHYPEAENSIKQAFNYLSLYSNPSGAAATLSFYAQLDWEQGRKKEALARYRIADAVMQATDDKAVELYNALKFAYALILTNRPDEARQVAQRALNLARRFGGQPHIERAELFISHAEEPELVKKQVES